MKIDLLEVDTGELTSHEYEYLQITKGILPGIKGPSAWMSAVYEFLWNSGYIKQDGTITEKGERAYAAYTARFASKGQA